MLVTFFHINKSLTPSLTFPNRATILTAHGTTTKATSSAVANPHDAWLIVQQAMRSFTSGCLVRPSPAPTARVAKRGMEKSRPQRNGRQWAKQPVVVGASASWCRSTGGRWNVSDHRTREPKANEGSVCRRVRPVFSFFRTVPLHHRRCCNPDRSRHSARQHADTWTQLPYELASTLLHLIAIGSPKCR